jgi:hypothetical protein
MHNVNMKCIIKTINKSLQLISNDFEWETGSGGGSGGILAILLGMQFLFRLALQNNKTPS